MPKGSSYNFNDKSLGRSHVRQESLDTVCSVPDAFYCLYDHTGNIRDFMDHLQYLSDVKKYVVMGIHSFSGTDENSSEVSKCFPSCGYNLQHSNQFLGVTI